MGELSKKIDFIIGPTGVGKSRLALSVAKKLGAGILNADSVQFYQGVEIGANKPTASELSSCPHFLLNFVSIGQTATAADFVRAAKLELQNSNLEHYLLVGGSGFYIQALEKGMYLVPKTTPEAFAQIKTWMDEGGFSLLYQQLIKLDPRIEGKIHPNDHYRIGRSLEMILSTDKSLDQIKNEKKSDESDPLAGFQIRKLGLWMEKEAIKEIVISRTEKMLRAGLVDETKQLLEKAGPEWPPLKSIGYDECVRFLKNELKESDLVLAIVQSTMKLVKKQMTWFKRDPSVIWFHAEKEFSKAQEYLYKSL